MRLVFVSTMPPYISVFLLLSSRSAFTYTILRSLSEDAPLTMNKPRRLIVLILLGFVSSCSSKEAQPPQPQELNAHLYFFARDATQTHYGLWKTGGTPDDTVLIKNYLVGSPSIVAVPDQRVFYFAARGSGPFGKALWKSDGTTEGTVVVKDIDPVSGGIEMGFAGTALRENVLFFANDGVHGRQLWKSNGSEAGTVALSDWRSTNSQGSPTITDYSLTDLATLGEYVYFAADDGVHGLEVWKSDGTRQGTVLVKDVRAGPGGSYPSKFAGVGGRVYFFANGALWVSDGTADGTQVLLDSAWSGAPSSSFVELNGTVLFTAAAYGGELWRTDGTPGGTRLVADINSGGGSSNPEYLTVLGNAAYFAAYTDTHGDALWKTDGTSFGTTLVKDINPDVFTGGRVLSGLIAFNNAIYFRARSASSDQLWKSDGTENGTVLLNEVSPYGFRVTNNRLFFVGTTVEHGEEMWVSDGTAEGTTLLKDVCPGACNGLP